MLKNKTRQIQIKNMATKKPYIETIVKKSENRDGSQSKMCRVPKPILEFLNTPNSIQFVIDGTKIVVGASEK